MAPKLYRIIEHTADTGFEVRGDTKEHVFEAAALAFFHIMWGIEQPKVNKPEIIEVTGSDIKELLVNFLEEFLYLYDAKGFICSQLKVETVTDTKICAKAWLQQFNIDRDQELLGVKAVTYHQLHIGKKEHKWLAQVFLDI
jgi:SHS2 domain-containing protein